MSILNFDDNEVELMHYLKIFVPVIKFEGDIQELGIKLCNYFVKRDF